MHFFFNGIGAVKGFHREANKMSIFPSENETPDVASKKAKLNACARTTSLPPSSSRWSAAPPWLSPTKSPGRDEMHLAVPFSWEDVPGVPKRLIHSALPRRPANNNSNTRISQQQLLLRPPPLLCSESLDRHRHRDRNHPEKKGGRGKDDPFVAALVKCTKHGHRQGKEEGDRKRGFSSNIFSCLSKACPVRESHIILPRLALSETKLGRPPQPDDHRKMINSILDVHDPQKETDKLFYYAVPSSRMKF